MIHGPGFSIHYSRMGLQRHDINYLYFKSFHKPSYKHIKKVMVLILATCIQCCWGAKGVEQRSRQKDTAEG